MNHEGNLKCDCGYGASDEEDMKKHKSEVHGGEGHGHDEHHDHKD